MAAKRFGPTLDAGVVIIEKEAERTIQPAALGTTAYAGVLERGPTDELIQSVSLRDMISKVGDLVPESVCPDACQDFWRHSEGAGALLLKRVTDGNEVKSTLTLLDRKLPRNPVIRVDAKNGGAWGGRQDEAVADLDAVPGDIQTETTVKLPDLYIVPADKFKGGTIKFSETGTSYEIVSHTAGNGTAGAVVTVAADALMLTDYAAGTDAEVILTKDQSDVWGRERRLAVLVKDGEIDPAAQWGLEVYINGDLVKAYPNLSSDPNSNDYFAKIVNEDNSNNYVEVTDLWTGAITADVRPANDYGEIPAGGITSKSLTTATVAIDLTQQTGTSTIGTFTFGADLVPDKYRFTYQSGTTDWLVQSLRKQVHHTFPTALDTVAYTAENSLSIGFTITEAGPVNGDIIEVEVLALRTSDAVGGQVFPDVDNAPNASFRITSNDETSVTIATGDLTTDGAVGDNYRLQFAQELEGGYDGLSVEANIKQDLIDAFDVPTSKFNDSENQGYGLIKFATPGVYDLLSSSDDGDAVQQAGVAYAEAKNHQFRYELDPADATDEVSAKDEVNNTLGRSDHAKVIWPSYADVADPILTNRLKTVSITGMVHGREALTARTFGGYHKVAAGVTVTLPNIREIPTGDTRINGEIINPVGIQRIETKNGRFVVWGARIPSVDPAFKFSQHRETLSHYEQVLIQSFDFILFAINDEQAQPPLVAALKSFFLPEWRKRALRGDTFEDAAAIKIDSENNTDATRAAGELNAEVILRLADTVEKFIITISRAGVFEATAAV